MSLSVVGMVVDRRMAMRRKRKAKEKEIEEAL